MGLDLRRICEDFHVRYSYWIARVCAACGSASTHVAAISATHCWSEYPETFGYIKVSPSDCLGALLIAVNHQRPTGIRLTVEGQPDAPPVFEGGRELIRWLEREALPRLRAEARPDDHLDRARYILSERLLPGWRRDDYLLRLGEILAAAERLAAPSEAASIQPILTVPRSR